MIFIKTRDRLQILHLILREFKQIEKLLFLMMISGGIEKNQIA